LEFLFRIRMDPEIGARPATRPMTPVKPAAPEPAAVSDGHPIKAAPLVTPAAPPNGHRSAPETVKTPDLPEVKKIGRNDPCPCGSGKKYKKCCGK
jgi:preprotein translocase subunit SecA